MLYDYMGRRIKSIVFNTEVKIETTDWSQGIYTIRIGDQVKQLIIL